MAKIKGIMLINVTNFKGHEGEPCKQGSIYFKGKKVGYYSDDFMMGPSIIDFDSNDFKKEIKSICKEYYLEHPDEKWFPDQDESLDMLFSKLIDLIDAEKEYKKMAKKGFPVLATYRKPNGIGCIVGYRTIEYARIKLEGNADVINPKIYSDLSDFVIK